MRNGSLLGLVSMAACLALASLGSAATGCGKEESAAKGPSVRIFADARFYLERPETEETIRGVLRRATVREGPDTRDMPFELVTDDEQLAVYVSGVDQELLRPFVDREVEVIGKRIDLRDEGFGVEVWIGTISIPEAGVDR